MAQGEVNVPTFNEGEALADETRVFMEDRFGSDFRHVRIHTDAWAEATAQTLCARAFTLGPDIFFAKGQYDPETHRGLRLLAHELVHVVQQGPNRPGPGNYPVGSLDRNWEREAEAIADEILVGRICRQITRDTSHTIRPSISVSSPTLTVTPGAAKPGCSIAPKPNDSGRPLIDWHLTQGYSSAMPAQSGDAWTATGTVALMFDPGDEARLDYWDFGFIQYMRLNSLTCIYASSVAKGGSITVDAAKPPAITTKLLLDGTQNSSILPWTNSNTSGSKCVRRPFPLNPGAIGVFPFYTPTASIKMGDHPMARVPAILINAKTNVDNHLLSVVDDREFWTIFAVRNPAKKFQFLAHFHAKLRWDIRFKWKAAIPFATMQAASSFKCDPVEMGPPKELQNLLKNPTGPIFNTQLQLAIKAAFPSPGTPNRMDADDQVAVVPKDFFK